MITNISNCNDFKAAMTCKEISSLVIPTAALYIHVPFCKQKCAYCDFYSVTGNSSNYFLEKENKSAPCSRFIKKILNDVSDITSLFRTEYFSSIYIGGGTPSLLSSEDILYLGEKLTKKLLPHTEFTIELNPESVTNDFIDAAIAAGINRFSLGVQTFSEQILKSQYRITTPDDIENALKILQRATMTHNIKVSCDLISGFPLQTQEQARYDIRTLLKYSIQHISVYRLCTDNALLDSENDEASFLFDCAAAELYKAGFTRYEISNFAQDASCESSHNKTYWKLLPYFGVGPSAAGSIFFNDACKYKNREEVTAIRTTGMFDINRWLQNNFPYTIETISFENEVKDFLLMGLRLKEGIDKENFFQRFGFSFDSLMYDTIKKFSNFVACNSEKKFSLTDEGLNFLSAFLVDAFIQIENFLV